MDPLVNVDGIFPSYHLIDGRASLLLLATLLCRSHLSNAAKHPCMCQRQTHLPSGCSPCRLPSSHHPQLLTSHTTPTFRNFRKFNLNKVNSSPGVAPAADLSSNFSASQRLYSHRPDRGMKPICNSSDTSQDDRAPGRPQAPLKPPRPVSVRPSPFLLQGDPGGRLGPLREGDDGAGESPSKD